MPQEESILGLPGSAYDWNSSRESRSMCFSAALPGEVFRYCSRRLASDMAWWYSE